MHTEPTSAETKQRLLEAAGEVFAEVGYQAATVRTICDRARANVAAVNYHFGDKDRLYEAVVRFAHDCALERYPAAQPHARATPEQRLAAFVRALLARVLDEGRPAWHGRLMAREMVAPTRVLDLIVRETIRGQFELLSGIVGELLGKHATPEQVRLGAMSVVGQCLFYRHAQPVIQRLFPRQRFGARDIDRLAAHITRFSLAGLHDGARRKK
ncbi:MAG: CerR family C-terminal domain-containing protein [Planctomycetota bacterium]